MNLSPGDEARLELLKKTIPFVYENSPFFAENWKSTDLNIESLNDISKFSIVYKDDLRNLDYQFNTYSQMPDYIQFTGGTLETPTMLHRSSEEAQVWEQRNEMLHGLSGATKKELSLKIITPTNGIQFSVQNWPKITVPLVLEKNFVLVDQLLRREFDYQGYENQISQIASGLDRLKLLTAFIIEKNIDVKKYAVKTLISSATYLTPKWRKLIEETWQANVIEAYGLSECPGALFTSCTYCEKFHLEPFAIAEVICPSHDIVLDQGCGNLVLTALYPFSQTNPIVRYWTGDFVEICGYCEDSQEKCYRFKGREVQSAVVDIDNFKTPLFYSTDIVECLDTLPEIEMEPEQLVRGLRTKNIGHYKWKIETNDLTLPIHVCLVIGLNYSPYLFPDRTAEIEEIIEKHLYLKNPHLEKLIKKKKITFSVMFKEPGNLEKTIV